MPRSKPKKRSKARKTSQRVRTDELCADVVLLRPPEGMEKMSQVLIDFVEPYDDLAETIEEQKMLLEIGAQAWNLALLPREKRESIFKAATHSTTPHEEAKEAELFVKELVHRKERYFGDCMRLILSVDFTPRRRGFDIHVLSTPLHALPEGRLPKPRTSWRNLFGLR
ncbi:MAG: hypothetical protein AB1646_21125 [Thermodesulfobacteriota bacterium]